MEERQFDQLTSFWTSSQQESDWAANAFGQSVARQKYVTMTSELMLQTLSILAGRTFGFQDNHFAMFEAFNLDVSEDRIIQELQRLNSASTAVCRSSSI